MSCWVQWLFLAGAFGVIKRDVGGLEQCLFIVAMNWVKCQAEGNGNRRQQLSINADFHVTQAATQTIAPFACSGLVGISQQDRKFLAAEPACGVAQAAVFAQDPTDAAQSGNI